MPRLINYNEQIPDDLKKKHRNPNPDTFAHPCRVIACGPSGVGKTSAVTNFIVNPELKLDYDCVWIFARYIDEELWQSIIRKLKDAEKKLNEQNRIDAEESGEEPEEVTLVRAFSDLNDLPALESLPKKEQHLIVFDDMLYEKSNEKLLHKYFMASRKFGVSIFFLAQSSSSIDKDIRRNTTGAMLFDFPSPSEANNLARDFAGNLSAQAFSLLYKDAVDEKYEFLTIDTARAPEERFRQNMGDFIDPAPFVKQAELAQANKGRRVKLKKLESDDE